MSRVFPSIGPLIAAGFLSCAAVASGTKTTLPDDMQKVIRAQYGDESRYVAAQTDLNGDLHPEYVVYVVGSMACGSGGCPTLIFTPEDSGHRLVSVISLTRPPIGVSTSGMAGWRNLVVHVGGGGSESADVELSSDGMIYPYNPTVRGPLVRAVKPGQEFKVVIADLASFADATPLTLLADCAKTGNSVDKLVCGDTELASLDRALATAYGSAMTSWPVSEKSVQRSAQQAWIAERNACSAQRDPRACVETSYRRRLIEVQITSGQLVAPTAVGYVCNGRESEPFSVAFYEQTDPDSAVITLGDRQSIAFAVPSGSGARYRNADVEFREHQGQATVKWSGTTLTCRAR